MCRCRTTFSCGSISSSQDFFFFQDLATPPKCGGHAASVSHTLCQFLDMYMHQPEILRSETQKKKKKKRKCQEIERTPRLRGWFHDPSSHRRRWICRASKKRSSYSALFLFPFQGLIFEIKINRFLHDDVKEEEKEDCFNDSVYSTEVIVCYPPRHFHPPTNKTRKRGIFQNGWSFFRIKKKIIIPT